MSPPCVTRRSTCILCGSPRLELAVPYPPSPVADAYLSSADAAAAQPRYPLDLHLCLDCGEAQLRDVVDPNVLFADYTYETSVSAGLVAHFQAYAEAITAYAGAQPGSAVVEIGSNDGSLLRFFQQRGMRVLGVDPAAAIAEKASRSGVETVPAFFSLAVASQIRSRLGAAHVVAANNVFAHSDALPDMADGIRHLLAPEGIFVFEVSYLPDILERRLFDTVYHEHLCYHAALPMQRFLAAHGLELIEFVRVPTKGGSFRGIAQRAGGRRPVQPSVAAQIALEREAGYGRLEVFQAFSAGLQATRRELLDTLRGLRRRGRRIAGYGASATVTTLMHYFELHGLLDFLVDDNPKKQGTFAPGSTVPVLPPAALLERRADVAVVLAWNYAAPIIAKQERFRSAGGQFIVPMPTVQLV